MKEVHSNVCKEQTTKDAGTGQELPPILIGGVKQLHERLICGGCDWLSLSVFGESIASLEQYSVVKNDKDAPTFMGFKMHELRAFIGSTADRHYMPHSKSPKHGHRYELWNWRGEQARSIGPAISGGWWQTINDTVAKGDLDRDSAVKTEGMRATRVDIAFDLHCTAECRPVDLRDGCADVWRVERGMQGEIGGQDGTPEHTAYIGGRSAERRIRIYRKDIESPWMYDGMHVMRVELVLKEQFAREAFWTMLSGEQAFLEAAAAHIEDMTGMRVAPVVGEIPTREAKEMPELAAAVAAMIRQYGPLLFILKETGTSVDRLVSHRVNGLSRTSRWRLKKKLKQARAAGSASIEQGAYDLLQE
jgi:hypothetical protein